MSSPKKEKVKLFTDEEVNEEKKTKKVKEDDEKRKRLMFKHSRSSSSKNLTSKKIDQNNDIKVFSKDDLKLPLENIKPSKSDKKKLKKATSSSNLKSKLIKPESKTKINSKKEKDTQEEIKVKHQKYASTSESTDDTTGQTSSDDVTKSDIEKIQTKTTIIKNLPLTSQSFNSLPTRETPSENKETNGNSEDERVKDIPQDLILKEIPLSPHKRGIDPCKASPRATYVIASPRDDKATQSKDPLSPVQKIGRVRSFTDIMDPNKMAENIKEKEKPSVLKPSTPPPPQPLTPPPPPPLPGQSIVVNAKYIENTLNENTVKITERKSYKEIEEEYKNWDFRSSDFEKRLFELKLDRSNIQSMFNFPENDIIIELLESDLSHYPPICDSAPLTIKDCYNYFTSKKIKIRMQSEWYGGITSHKDRVKDYEMRKNANSITNTDGKPKSGKLEQKKTPTRQVQKRKHRVMSSSERLEKITELESSDKTDDSEDVSDVSETESSEQSETKIKIHKSNSFGKRSRSPLTKREKSDDRRLPIVISKSDRPRSLSINISDSPAFHLNPDFLNFDDKIRKKEAEKRDRARKDLFECFTPSTITSEPSDEVQDLKSSIDDVGTKILFNFKNIKVNAGLEEPFWFSATFYDISKQCRLTETFYFDFNSENELIKSFLVHHFGGSTPETQAKRFIPSFPYCNENIYLVIRVSTVVKGDIENIAEPHSHGHSMSAKEKQKWIDSSRQATQILGMYQQSFGWGFIQIFDEKGKLKLGNENIINIFKMKQSLTDSVLYDQLAKSDEVKKHKPLNFTINVSANIYSEEKYILNDRVDSMLVHYPKPIEKQYDNDKASMILKNLVKPPQEINEIVKELDNFYIHSSKNHPHDQFVNNLYIYPLSANFQTSKIHKAKRIACKVHLLETVDNEDDAVPIQQVALDVIYGRSYGSNIKNCGSTTIWIDTNTPNMWDEIKIKLPLNLTERHHLLFSFYNINIKILSTKPGKQSSDDPIDNLIGYCYVPIYANNQIIKDNEHVYPIMSAPFGDGDIKNYVNKNASDDEYIDSEKVVFTFRSRLISTVLTQDDNMNAYFVYCNSAQKGKKDLKKALDRLMCSEPSEVLRFFPVLLNQLFVFLCDSTNESIQQHIFKTIVWIASKVFDKTLTSGKVSVSHDLLVYAKNDFRNPVKCKSYPSTVILQHWVNLLEEGSSSAEDSQVSDLAAFSVKEISWFLFELIFKSLVLKLTTNNESRKEATKPIKKNLKKIVQRIDHYRRKTASGFEFINRVFAKMITRLFHVIDRGFVFDLIYEYLNNLKGERSTVGYRFIFLQILSDFEHYIQLNLPQLTPVDSCEILSLKLWKNHYLAGLYINELIESLLSQEDAKISRVKAITRFRDLLWKHHIDDRYDDNEKRTRIASIYFPLFLRIVENFQTFQTKTKDDESERVEWCICILWILKHCSRDVHLRQWWKNESGVNVSNFFKLLKLCYETFGNDEAMKSEIIYLMLEIYDLIMDDLYDEMNSAGSMIFEALSTSILYLLRLPKTEHATISLFKIIRTFTTKFKKPLFRYLNNYMFCGDLTYEVFNLCQGKSKKIMTAATSILYLLLRSNNDEMKHFARMKLLSTSAISKLVKRSDCNVDDIRNCLEAMAHYQDERSTLLSWENQIREFINRNSRIIKYNLEIQSIPPEFNDHKAETMNQISLEYFYSPDLRVTWLENLTSHYVSHELYEEAALCKILIASLISEYLVHMSNNRNSIKGVPEDAQAFTKIFPSIKEEKSFSTIWLEGNTILLPDFSEDGFLKNLNTAIEYFLKSENLESCVEVYSLLLHYYKENKKYEMLSQCSQQLSKVSQTLFESTQSQNRIPPNFYRVGFYGVGFEDDNGKEYIYREPPSVRISDFTQKMCNRYIAKFGKDNFELLSNKPIEELDIDPTKKNYIQIVACEIAFSFEELISKDRLTYADRSFDIKKFYFETPYIREGTKPTEDVAQLWKRKIILYPAKAPPYHLQRIPVIKKETQILTPIQSAIDVVTGFVTNIKQQLNCVPPNIKNVQIILQGSILTQVNAGPLAIIREFLGNSSKYPPDEVKKLRTILNTFLRFSQFGMRLTAQLILTEKSLEPLHKEISKALDALQSEASKYMEL